MLESEKVCLPDELVREPNRPLDVGPDAALDEILQNQSGFLHIRKGVAGDLVNLNDTIACPFLLEHVAFNWLKLPHLDFVGGIEVYLRETDGFDFA